MNRDTGYDNTHRHRCWYHASDWHDILECITFQNYSISDKMDSFKTSGVCFNCLKSKHIARRCLRKQNCNATGINNETSGKLHHTSIHEGFVISNSNVGSRRNCVLFMVNEIKCGDYKLNTLFDSGANMTMIRTEMVNALGLKGSNIRLAVTKLGNHTVTYHSEDYDVNITAYGIDDITSHIDKVDLTKVRNL